MDGETVASRRRKLHSALGVGPLFVFMLVHAWETSAALRGRDAFAQSLSSASGTTALLFVKSALVLLPLLLHAALGLGLIARLPENAVLPRYSTPGLRRLQQVTGVLTAIFLVEHLFVAWAPRIVGGNVSSAYDALMLHAGVPWHLVIAATGVASVCFHLAQGLAAACVSFGVVAHQESLKRVRVISGAVSFLLFCILLNTLSHFAAGRALLFEDAAPIHEAANVE